MKSPITKMAAAAVIIMAVTLGLFVFIGTGRTSVVWAEVVEKVRANQGLTFRTKQTQTITGMDKPIETSSMTCQSPTYGLKIDSCPGEEKTTTTCVSYVDRTWIMLMHRTKQYAKESLSEDEVPQNQGQSTPKDMVTQFLSGEYKKLGQQIIEGVLAEGIEVNNPPGGGGNFTPDSCVGRLWVSVETGYPVLLDIEVVGNNGDVHIEMTMDQFQWNVELDASAFQVDIPPDYTLMEMPRP